MSKNLLSSLAEIALDNSAIVPSIDIDNQTIADVLTTNPEAMARFEAAYKTAMASAGDTGSVFTTNAKQAVSKLAQRNPFKGSKKKEYKKSNGRPSDPGDAPDILLCIPHERTPTSCQASTLIPRNGQTSSPIQPAIPSRFSTMTESTATFG